MVDQAWKPIPGYEDRYAVSRSGCVQSLKFGRPMAVHIKFDYPKVFLFKDKKAKWFFVHRLVWLAHRGPIPKGFVVNHVDHVKGNPRLENLELVTQEENVRQATERFGHSSRGDKYKQTIAKRRATKASAA